MDNSRKILDIKVDFLPKSDVLRRIADFLTDPDVFNLKKESKNHNFIPLICTTNPEFIIAAQKDPLFAEIINSSFLSVPDGIGVIYAKKYLDYRDYRGIRRGNISRENIREKVYKDKIDPVGKVDLNKIILKKAISKKVNLERISGADLIFDLCALAEEKDLSVFLLGGWPTNFWGRGIKNPNFDIAEETAKVLRNKFPKLRIIGATSQFKYDPKDDEVTINYIKDRMAYRGIKSIDLLFICYGQGNQEKWVKRNYAKIPARLSVGLGGTFDYVSGHKPRCPMLLRKMNLEWFYRLVTQPWRIKRMFTSCVIFPLSVVFKSR